MPFAEACILHCVDGQEPKTKKPWNPGENQALQADRQAGKLDR